MLWAISELFWEHLCHKLVSAVGIWIRMGNCCLLHGFTVLKLIQDSCRARHEIQTFCLEISPIWGLGDVSRFCSETPWLACLWPRVSLGCSTSVSGAKKAIIHCWLETHARHLGSLGHWRSQSWVSCHRPVSGAWPLTEAKFLTGQHSLGLAYIYIWTARRLLKSKTWCRRWLSILCLVIPIIDYVLLLWKLRHHLDTLIWRP